MVTASTLKAWLYRKISEIAAWNHAQAEDPECRTPLFTEETRRRSIASPPTSCGSLTTTAG